MGAKSMQIKMIIEDTEEVISELNEEKRVDADLLKTEKATAYEKIRQLYSDNE